MDPISIATAVASTATALYTTSQTIATFISEAKNVDKALKLVAGEVDSLLTILQTMKDILTTSSTQKVLETAKGYDTLFEAALASIQDCGDTAAVFQNILVTIKEGSKSQSFVARSIRQVRFLGKQDEIAKVQTQLSVHKSNLQLSLQTINLMVASLSGGHIIDSLGSKIDDLWMLLEKAEITNRTENDTSASVVSNDTDFIRHTRALRKSAIEVIDRTLPERAPPKYSQNAPDSQRNIPSSSNVSSTTAYYQEDADSDDELEEEFALELIAKGISLCREKNYAAAEPTLRNSLKTVQQIIPDAVSIESIKEAQLELAIAYLYQHKFDDAEEILAYLTTDSPLSEADAIRKLDAAFYLAQVHLAHYSFDEALGSSLLVLIYETSGDSTTAAILTKTISPSVLQANQDLPIYKFSSERLGLSVEREAAALDLLANNPKKYEYRWGNRADILKWAAINNHADAVRWLLYHGVNVDGRVVSHDVPALSEAASCGHDEVVKVLVQNGAYIDWGHTVGNSPLQSAAWNGHDSTMRLLLDRGAIIDENLEGSNSMVGAAMQGYHMAVRVLLEKGGNPNAECLSNGETALMKAAANRKFRAVKVLLEAGADVNRRDKEGKTSMMYAAAAFRNEDIVRILKEYGAE